MNLFRKLLSKITHTPDNVLQSRQLAKKLHDYHIKYACIKTETDDLIVGRNGHVNVVDEKYFELVFGVESAFRFVIDEMTIWEFMSLDGATVTGYDVNDGYEKTFMIYYDKHLE